MNRGSVLSVVGGRQMETLQLQDGSPMDAVQCVENAIKKCDHQVFLATDNVSVGIVVPVYHGEKFIQQLLDTINSQTYRDFILVLVIDDYEYDNTGKIVREHPLYKENKVCLIERSYKTSPAAARNVGIESVKADLVCFIDVDDTWDPHKLSNQVAYMAIKTLLQDEIYGVLFTAGWWHRDFGILDIMTDDVTVNNKFTSKLYLWSSVMIRYNLLMRVKKERGFIFDPSLRECDDTELLMYLRTLGASFGSVPWQLTHVYEHGGNLTQGNLWKSNWQMAKILYKYGHYKDAFMQIAFGLVAVTTEKLHIRQWLRRRKFIWRNRFGIENGTVASDRTDN